jgi:hypothetical protein
MSEAHEPQCIPSTVNWATAIWSALGVPEEVTEPC